MTLLEIERMIRKMSELLQQGGNPDIAPKLATDYASACHAANLRLQQCEAMIKAGDRHQAIQLAETAPNLLDLVTVLEFRNSDDWRVLCQQNALQPAERIDARSVQALNGCYAQGITTDHPLYAAYRKAVLNRNDEEALKALQSITRLNPADGNAASELARLDEKVLSARLAHLESVLNGGDTASVVAAIEAIEAFGFKTRPDGEVWCKAEAVRCSFMLEEAAKLKMSSQWMNTLAVLDFISRIQNEYQIQMPVGFAQQMEALRMWACGEQEKDRRNHEFGVLLAELHFRIQESEEKDTSARYVKLPEMKGDFEALHKVWRSLTDFTRPIPEDATAAFRKRSALLEAEISRRSAIRLRTVLFSGAAVLIFVVAIAWFVLGQMRAHDFGEQLQTAVSQRQVRAAERLLELLRNSDKRLLSFGSVNTAAAAAESFVTKERALLSNFEQAFAKLPSQLAGDPDAGRLNSIADHLQQTRAALNVLATDLKAENEPRLQAFEKRWQQFLADGGQAVNGLFEQWITDAEQQSAQLDYRASVTKASTQISTLSGLIQKLTDCEAGFTNHLSLRADLLQRADAVSAKFAAYDGELKKLDQGKAALEQARSFNDYSSAISHMASSEFSSSPSAVAASSIQSLGISEDAALRYLLEATNASSWAFINRQKSLSLVPEIAMPAELTFLQKLNGDPAVSGDHKRYRLWLDRDNMKNVEWITAGSLENSQGWKQIKAWAPSATAASATFEAHEYGYFDGQWKLSPTQPIYRVEQVVDSDETSAFATVGFGSLWSGGSTFGKPALEVLGAIKDSHEGSPVFRAYLFCRLVEFMDYQPDAWGLSFCPAVRSRYSEIQTIVGGNITSGDWFIPTKAAGWSGKLDQFFASQTSFSYAKQAAINLNLAQLAAKDGLRYVGFVGLDGKAFMIEGPPPAETWGYDAVLKQPTISAASRLPLSPLFALPSPRADYLAKAGFDQDAMSSNQLPRLFRADTKP